LHQQLENKIDEMRAEIDKQLQDEELLPSAKKLIKSLDNHWDGLVVFVVGSDSSSIVFSNFRGVYENTMAD